MVNVRGLRSVVEAGRRWFVTSVGHERRVKHTVVPLAMLAMAARGVPYHRRGVNYQCGKSQVDVHLDCYCSMDRGAC